MHGSQDMDVLARAVSKLLISQFSRAVSETEAQERDQKRDTRARDSQVTDSGGILCGSRRDDTELLEKSVLRVVASWMASEAA
jgi:hypothetical protein